MPERFYNLQETLALLGGISEMTLHRLRKGGKIKCVRVGCRPMFPASEIEAYQASLMGRAPLPQDDVQLSQQSQMTH